MRYPQNLRLEIDTSLFMLCGPFPQAAQPQLREIDTAFAKTMNLETRGRSDPCALRGHAVTTDTSTLNYVLSARFDRTLISEWRRWPMRRPTGAPLTRLRPIIIPTISWTTLLFSERRCILASWLLAIFYVSSQRP